MAFEGVVAVWVASMTVALVAGWLSPVVGLGLTLALVVPYLIVSALPPARRRDLPLPRSWRDWLAEAVKGEELALSSAIHPRGGTWKDGGAAVVALVTVVGASVAMELPDGSAPSWSSFTRKIKSFAPAALCQKPPFSGS